MPFNVRAYAFIHVLFLTLPAAAQLPSWVVEDPFSSGEDDPIGIDRSDRLEAVSPTRADEEVQAPIPVTHGEVVHAVSGVREDSHTVDVELAHGLAIVRVELRFVSSARHAAEVRYRLAVPEGASVAGLEVCNAHGCRQGLADASEGALGPYDDAVRSHADGAPLPVAHAALNGGAIELRAAPVMREARASLTDRHATSGPLTVRVRYVVAAPIRGGRVRFTIPARGRDTRATAARITVRSAEVSRGAVDGTDAVERAVERPAWEPAEISARLEAAPRVVLEGWRVRCGSRECTRLRAVAAPQPLRVRDVILLLDASPSMQGPARGRVLSAVGALLSVLPSGSRVRAAVFAARAEPVLAEPRAATEVRLSDIATALERELGSATRFEAAWALVEPWAREARDPLVVIVGDGGLTDGEAARSAFARAARVELASLNLADRASTPALREMLHENALDVGVEADRASRDRGTDALVERIAPLLSPMVEAHVHARTGGRTVDLGMLRAGEELVWEGVASRAAIGTTRAQPVPEELAIALRDRVERSSGRSIRLAALAPESIGAPGSCSANESPVDVDVAVDVNAEAQAQAQARPRPRSRPRPRLLASASAPVSRDVRLALADTRRCDPAAPDRQQADATIPAPRGRIARLAAHADESSLPSQSLLDMLRQRIVPVARGCFREDRRGRAGYSTRAVFEFRIADREVVRADVNGQLAPELRECLLRAMDGLEIPRFDGAIDVRYPVRTAAQLAPPTLTLAPEVADAVDAIGED